MGKIRENDPLRPHQEHIKKNLANRRDFFMANTNRRIITKIRNKARYEYIKFLRSLGMSYRSIGESFNPKVSRQAIHQVVKNYEERWIKDDTRTIKETN